MVKYNVRIGVTVATSDVLNDVIDMINPACLRTSADGEIRYEALQNITAFTRLSFLSILVMKIYFVFWRINRDTNKFYYE